MASPTITPARRGTIELPQRGEYLDPLEIEEDPPTLDEVKARTEELGFEEGLKYLEEILASSQNLDVRMFYAEQLLRGRSADLTKARESFEIVLKFRPGDAVALKSLALICNQQNKPAEAEKYFEKGSNDAKTLRSYAEFLKEQGQFERALEICERGLEHNRADFLRLRIKIRLEKPRSKMPEGKICKFHRIEIEESDVCPLHAGEDLAKILEDCDSFLAIRGISKPDKVEILDLAANIWEKKGDLQRAHPYLKKVNALDPSHMIERARKILAICLLQEETYGRKLENATVLQEKEPEEAWKLYTQVFEHGGRAFHFEALRGRAEISLAKKDFDSMRTDLARMSRLKLSPDQRSQWHILHKRAYIQEGNYEKAGEHWEEAWKLYKTLGITDKTLLKGYFDFLLEAKFFERALALCKETEGEFLSSAEETFYQRARIYSAWEKWPEAKEICDAWIRQGFKRIELLKIAAEACRQMSNDAEAYFYFEQAYRLDDSPSSVDTFAALQELYQKLPPGSTSQPLCRKEPSKICKAAQLYVEKDPKGAIKLFSHAVSLSSKDRIYCAKAHFFVRTPEHFDLAKKELEQIVLWKEQWALSPIVQDLKEIEMETHFRFARIYTEEGKFNEALSHWQQGWELCKRFGNKKSPWRGFAFLYLEFLKNHKSPKDALEISREAVNHRIVTEITVLYYEAYYYFESEEWERALTACEKLMIYRITKAYLQDLRDLAADICLRMGKYSRAKKYAEQAYETEKTPARFSRRFDARKADIVERHLEELIALRKNFPQPRQKIGYLSRILEAYRLELLTHHARHAEILRLRGDLRKSLGEAWQEDLEAAREVYQAAPNCFQQEIQEIEFRLREHSGKDTSLLELKF